ncbi:hypothetical protein [Aulosira sp. FACHB-615]|uniref:hypothetical protein n=1 Tax=Aulosira sp. FACHB-615 TaxID=2692777 RepID=UPI00168525AE|nr:hypothetical protein [Aulosira sp. FACHB-615]MBD2491970.1 hypothetical protein [Aulosira sp. FACHB-615]
MPYIAHTQQPISEQDLAQAELTQYISQQAQAVAPEPLTTVEINPNHFDIYAGKWLVAYITYDYDEFVTQPWVVMVNGVEKFRHTTQIQCHRFINWHHKDGTLNPQPSADVPEVPFISEISFYDQEVLADGELLASVSYSHDDEQNSYWQVMINNVEIFTDSTPARCHSYVKQQYQAGLLPVQKPFEEPFQAGEQGAGRQGEEFSPLHPAPCPVASSTGNEIMVQIAQACENFGLELLDDGIYRGDEKLGEVGETKGAWWFVRANESSEKAPCDSAMDAVYWLSMVDTLPSTETLDYEQLLELPFDQLTSVQWQKLLEYEPVLELIAA